MQKGGKKGNKKAKGALKGGQLLWVGCKRHIGECLGRWARGVIIEGKGEQQRRGVKGRQVWRE